MWVLRTPPMSAATAETRSSVSYQPGSIGSDGQLEGRARPGGGSGSASASGSSPVGSARSARASSSGAEQLAAGEEGFQAGPQIVVEEPRIGGGEHGGEHAERVARQLLAVDGAEGGGDDGHRAGGGLAQVVEADRVHAEGGEDARDLAHLLRGADPDRAVALRGHPADAAQPLGVGAAGGRRRR